MPSYAYRINLMGSDITARVRLGSESVDLTENAAGLMDCVYRPESGTQDADGPMFGAMTLEVNLTGSWVTLFSGAVIRATWDPKTRAYALRASTRMQEHFRAMASHDAVLAALPGAIYSNAVFGEPPDDLWDYAELLMSTREYAYWIGTDGTLQSAAWAAKATPDEILTADDVDSAGAFSYERADAETLTNQVIVEMDYQVQRKKVRSHLMSWDGPDSSICTWWAGTGEYGQWRMPWTVDVQVMAEASAWNVPNGVATDGPVPDGAGIVIDGDDQEVNGRFTFSWADCFPNSGDAFLTFYSVDSSWPVWSASAVGYIALTGQVTERYALTIRAEAHIAATGETVTLNRSGSLSVPGSEWPPDAPTAATYAGWATDTAGDHYADDADETARAAMLNCAYAWGSARIREGQRANILTCQMRLRTDLDLSSTVQVSAYGVASGPLKIRRIRHTMMPPRTDLTLAVSRGKGGTSDAWAAPARPDSSDPVTYWETHPTDPVDPYPMPDASTNLPTHVGLVIGADPEPDPDERVGWITNCEKGDGIYDPNGEEYSVHFAVEWPEVEEWASAGVEIDAASTWEIAVAEDSLSITA